MLRDRLAGHTTSCAPVLGRSPPHPGTASPSHLRLPEPEHVIFEMHPHLPWPSIGSRARRPQNTQFWLTPRVLAAIACPGGRGTRSRISWTGSTRQIRHLPAQRRLLAALGPRKLEVARDRAAGAIMLLVTPPISAPPGRSSANSVSWSLARCWWLTPARAGPGGPHREWRLTLGQPRHHHRTDQPAAARRRGPHRVARSQRARPARPTPGRANPGWQPATLGRTARPRPGGTLTAPHQTPFAGGNGKIRPPNAQ